jgi:hypothetical protein
MNCPHCQKELPENYPADHCLFCGQNLTPTVDPEKTADALPRNSSKLWLFFWLSFIGAPVLGLLSAMAQLAGGIFLFPLLGAIAAGFSLSKIYNRSPGVFFMVGVAFSIGILIIYFGIVFVGCLVVMSGSHF